MKKMLLIAGIGVGVAFAAIVVMLIMANRVGDSVQREFFDVVADNDPDAFLDAADPRMREEIDAPLLKQWMQAMNKNLGSYEGLEPTDFHSSTRFEDGNRIVETTGTVRFQHGTAKSELAYVNGKLKQFRVTSDQLGEKWLGVPEDTTNYRAQANCFYEEFARRNSDEAFGYLSEALKEKLTLDDFQAMVDRICDALGEFQNVQYVGEQFINSEDAGQRLLIRYKMVGTKGTFDAEAVFVFHGLKAHFNEFNVAVTSD